MKYLIPFMVSLECLCMYQRKTFIGHLMIITIVYGYNLARNSYMEYPYQSYWVPTYFGGGLRWSSTQYSTYNLSFLMFAGYIILVLEFSAHTLLTGVFSDVYG